MNPTDLFKRAPRWAIYTAGGVIVGGFALKMAKNRTTSTSSDAAAVSDVPAEQVGSGPYYGQAGASPGVIVPPVIIDNPNSDQSGTGLGALQDLFMGGAQSLYDAYGNLTSQVMGQNQQLIDVQANTAGSLFGLIDSQGDALAQQQASTNAQLAAIVAAGSAPQPAAQNPTPVYADTTPAPAPAPVSTPAPAPPAPDPCTGTYPNQSSSGCYKVVCASGNGDKAKGRWHYYANGRQVHVSNTC